MGWLEDRQKEREKFGKEAEEYINKELEKAKKNIGKTWEDGKKWLDKTWKDINKKFEHKRPDECKKNCASKSSIEWEKQPGATDEDVEKAKKMWEDAKLRRLPDGSKPETVEVMEFLEKSDKKTKILVGPNGNSASPDSWRDAKNPKKGSAGTIEFNPNKKGTMGDGTERDPESSLAHEAFHVFEFQTGKIIKGGDMLKQTEVNATSAENWHRKAKGLPQRKKYGTWDIPQH